MGTKTYNNYEDLLTFTRASKGHALRPVSYGSELVTNGTFDTDTTGWTASGTQSVVNGKLYWVRSSLGGVYQSITTKAGSIYVVDFTLSDSVGSVRFSPRDGSVGGTQIGNVDLDDGTRRLIFIALSSTTVLYWQNISGSGGEFYLDDVSAKEVTFDESDGTLTLFEHPNNVPRVEYDADGNRLGLLVEEQRTNLITRSDLDGANPTGWTTFSLGGTRTATTLYGLPAIRFQATDERPLLQLPLTLSASTTYTMSCYIENTGGTNEPVLELNSITGITGDQRIRANEGDSKGYASVTFTTGTDTSGYLRIGLGTGGPATGDVTLTAIQIEEGSFGTSYIKTTGSSATRSADVASIPVADFGYNHKEITVMVEFIAPNWANSSTYHRVLSFDGKWGVFNDGNLANGTVRYRFDNDSGVAQYGAGNLDPSPYGTSENMSKVAFALKNNDAAITKDGNSVGTDTSGDYDIELRTTLTIGAENASTHYLSGHLKTLKVYPRRLTNAQLQDITS